MNRNQTATQHSFGVVPMPQFPRSQFLMSQTRKQAFDASDLIPIMCEEVLPGDTWRHRESIFARLATPIAPVVDDLYLETFYFFIPNRIASSTIGAGSSPNNNNWEAFITGAADIAMPRISPPLVTGHYTIPVGSVFDHFGIPPGAYTARPLVTALPIWDYLRIWNEWFRDQNLQGFYNWNDAYDTDYTTDDIETNDEEAIVWDMMPLRINKRSDYFTRSLPFAQKGNPVTLPLGTTAPVLPITAGTPGGVGAPTWQGILHGSGAAGPALGKINRLGTLSDELLTVENPTSTSTEYYMGWDDPNLYTDLSSATATTINALRLAAITQQLLERDARGGSRYVENILAHWGVRSPDYRMYRPEYLGGSSIPITVNPIAQTATYDAQPDDTPSAVGNLGAEMHASSSRNTFNFAATEHGYIIGVCAARAKPTYQQGFRRHWISRNTRLDYYDPLFANLGEQQVQTLEIFAPLDMTPDNITWGYQEQGAEYRYTPNEITGVLRSTAPQPLDWWHYAEEFGSEPALNADFITDKTKETLARSLATSPSAQWSAQIIMDINHSSRVARMMPAYAIPGIDRF